MTAPHAAVHAPLRRMPVCRGTGAHDACAMCSTLMETDTLHQPYCESLIRNTLLEFRIIGSADGDGHAPSAMRETRRWSRARLLHKACCTRALRSEQPPRCTPAAQGVLHLASSAMHVATMHVAPRFISDARGASLHQLCPTYSTPRCTRRTCAVHVQYMRRTHRYRAHAPVGARLCVCVCVRVCVGARLMEIETRSFQMQINLSQIIVCVCVCVCVRARARV
jgi:hypothetical protein